MKVPERVWLVHFYGPPIDGFKVGPWIEGFGSERGARKKYNHINSVGGMATLLGPYDAAQRVREAKPR